MGILNISEQLGIGRNTGSARDLERLAKADWYDPRFQSYLPEPLRWQNVDPYLRSGLSGIGELMRNPGGISPTVGSAIRPFLANESQNIATNYKGLMSNQAGSAARNNLPVSIKSALESALGIAQERAQREARNTAVGQSEQLRRSDLEQVWQLLQILGQYAATGRGQGLQGLGEAADINQKRQAANLAFASSMAMMGASNSRFKEKIKPILEEEILDAIRTLPVYGWHYKGDPTPHIGPMAEDFHDTFGVGEGPDRIGYLDAVGTLMAATQALAKKVERLEAR